MFLSFTMSKINCSIFDNNRAADGSAMNLAYYSAKFDNVTFRNNMESAIRVSLTKYTVSSVVCLVTM